MKKIHSCLLLLAAMLMMATACSKDNDVIAPNDDDNNPQPHTYLAPCFTADAGSTVETRTLTISPNGQADANALDARHSSSAQSAATGSHAAEADTRAVVEDNPNYRNGELFRWVANEEVLVWFEKADGTHQTITYKITNVNEALCDLVPVGETAVIAEGDYTVYGMYPADKWTTLMNGGSLSVPILQQYGHSSEGAGKYSLMKSTGKQIKVKQGETFGMSFEHLTSMLRMSFNNNSDNSNFTITSAKVINTPSKGEDYCFIKTIDTSGSVFHPSYAFSKYTLTSSDAMAVGIQKENDEAQFDENGIFHAYIPMLPNTKLTGSLEFRFVTAVVNSSALLGTQIFEYTTTIDAERVNDVWGYSFQSGFSYFFGSKFSSLTITNESKITLASTAAGSITQELIRKRLSPMGTLKVTGTINTTDLKTLNSWSTTKGTTDMKLSHLDLSAATISGTTEFPASFKNNKDLISISLPTTGINSLAVNAFDGCSKLSSVALPADNEGFTTIGSYAFRFCAALTNIAIPNSVTSIGQYVFQGCTSLQSVTLPDNLLYLSIAENLFYGCTSLESIEIPSSVGSIGIGAFYNCSSENLTKIVIPNSVRRIDTGAFQGCTSLQSVTLPTNPEYTTIANYLFDGCTALESIVIPSSVTSIGNNAFNNCYGLETITLPQDGKLTAIGEWAFNGCYNEKLTSITIPNSVNSIGTYAFNNCNKLKSITLPQDNSEFTTISESAFNSCTALESIVIPGSVTSIGTEAFNMCYGLETITLPQEGKLTAIGEWAFSGCYNEKLTSITIPNSVNSIGVGAFLNCYKLKSITLPQDNSDFTAISESAFFGCTALESIDIPSSVTSIGNEAFNSCCGLESITLPQEGKLAAIGESAFQYCNNEKLTEITIPNSVNSIGANAFQNCSKLKSITLPQDNSEFTTISESAFFGCTALESIVIPSSVTSIGNCAFYNCTNLRDVDFAEGSNIASLGDYAFRECSSLSTMVFPSTTSSSLSIGANAFYSSPLRNLVFEVTKEQAPSINWSFVANIFSSDTRYNLFLPNVTTAEVAFGVYGSLIPVPYEMFFHYNGDASTASTADKIKPWNYKNND